MSLDPFATASLRAAVVEAWRRSPARLREDANTEEDHARGYYRDRIVVELAQNAADAAARTDSAGRLLLRLTAVEGRPVLLAANTGAPLDAAGVAALATMRASAKRDVPGLVGRFGVGFAAARAVADEILAATRAGAVRFSLDRTRELLAAEPAFADELARRGDSLPVLRLPFDADGALVAGGPPVSGAAPAHDDVLRPDPVLAFARRALADFDTVIVLELRDTDAVSVVRSLLGEVADPFLLALPALGEITVETPDGAFTVADVEERWHVVRRSGSVDAAVLADRPTEERGRPAWQLSWALPHVGAQREGVVLAPTPTMDPLTLPALLIGTLPLDPTRRHIATGPLTDELVAQAGALYSELGVMLADAGRSPLDLVPTLAPASDLDARLRRTALEALAAAPVLDLGAGGRDAGVRRVAPREATALAGDVGTDPTVVTALARAAENLVVLRPGEERRAATLGVRMRSVGDVVDELGALPSPTHWRELYDALAPAAVDPGVRESLAGIGVPLADGRTVRGPRGTVVVRAEPDVVEAAEALAPWGLRLVHPDAEHPLLERLGADAVDATRLLALPAVRAAIDAALDDDDVAAAVASAVLTIASAATDLPPWIGDLPLPDADGGLGPARDLVAPGTPAEELFDLDVVGLLAADVAERWSDPQRDGVLHRIGVITGLAVRVIRDVATGPSLDDDELPDGWHDYLDELTERLGADVMLGDLEIVDDLDAVRLDAWPAALRELDTDPATHHAVTRQVRGLPSYSAWWLRRASPEHLGLGAPFALGAGREGPGESVPGESVPGATVPGVSVPGATVPGVSVPGAPVPGVSVPGDSAPGETAPDDSAPGETAPDDSAPYPAVGSLLGGPPVVLAGRSVAFQAALGGVTRLADLDPHDWAEIDLGDEGDTVDPATARAVWDAIAADPDAWVVKGARSSDAPSRPDALPLPDALSRADALSSADTLPLPDALWPAVVAPDRIALAPARDVVVVPGPHWFARTDVGPMLPGPRDPDRRRELARRLGLPALDEQEPADDGVPGRVPQAALALVPGAPATWREHDDLRVAGQPVEWWPPAHAVHVAGLARALAWSSGHWERRAVVELALTEPARAGELAVEVAAEEYPAEEYLAEEHLAEQHLAEQHLAEEHLAEEGTAEEDSAP